jgi:hypothetical protein
MNTKHCTIACTGVESAKLDKEVKLLIGIREAFDTGSTQTFDTE